MRKLQYLAAVVVFHSALFVPPRLSASEPQSNLGSIERQALAIYEKIAPAVVRIEYGASSSISGVIVTADGHVLTYGLVPGNNVIVHFADGKSAKGTTLGFSEELGIGLVKISETGPWPHVGLENAPHVKIGDLCIALGYPRRGDGRFDRQPTLRLGAVTASGLPAWLSSSCAVEFCDIGCGLFDLEGRLLGVNTRQWGGAGPVHTGVETVKSHFDFLAAGKRLDGEMLGKAADGNQKASREVAKTESPPEEHGVASATERAKAATVRIRPIDAQKPGWSGVIVSSDGFITTCAHTGQVAGERVTVSLADGRDVDAVVLGTNRVSDVGLVKIMNEGPWPSVALGNSFELKHDDPTVIIGYPASDSGGRLSHERQPLVQKVPVVSPPSGDNPYLLWTSKKYDLQGGMSGGGVFDRQGRLIAVHCGVGNPRIEVIRRQWESLVASKSPETLSPNPLQEIDVAFRDLAQHAPPIVVEVLGNNKRLTLGTIVRSDGLILTKASELDGNLSCRLADGRVLPATVRSVSRRHDLAVLEVAENKLPMASWNSADLRQGALVAAIVPGKPPRRGVVSQGTREISAEPVWLGEGLRDSDTGLRVVGLKDFASAGLALKEGDVIIQIEDQRVPDLRAFVDLMKSNRIYVGDPVEVRIKREDKTLQLRFRLPIGSREWYQKKWLSPRRSGFPAVLDADLPLTADLCGGPVIDKTGSVIGVIIAFSNEYQFNRQFGGAYIVPIAVAMSVIAD